MKCQRCKGSGEITVVGGDWDEHLSDICTACEGKGRR